MPPVHTDVEPGSKPRAHHHQGCVKLVRKVKPGLGLERFFGTIDLEYCWLGGCQSQNECRTETNKLSWMNWK